MALLSHAADTANNHKIDRREFHHEKLVLAALLASCAFGASAAEKINFGVSATYPPFESMDANNQIVGFDIDLAKRYANRCRQNVLLPITRSTA